MIARVAGAALLVLGAAVAVLPALTWYSAPPTATPTGASGFAGSGVLWLLPLLGAAIALSGAGLVAARPGLESAVARWTGPLALVAGLMALAFSLWATADPDLSLRVTIDGATESVPVAVTRAPAAIATPILAAAAAAIGLVAGRVGRRR